MNLPYRLILGFMIASFLLVWGSTNHYPLKSYLKLVGTSGKLRLMFTLVLIVQVFVPSLFQLPESLRFAEMETTGAVIAFIGMALAIWAKLAMKKSWGVPGQHDPAMQPELVMSGPFGFSRNPIYVGLFLFLIGFELGMMSWLILVAIPVAFMIHRAVVKEEMRLTEVFGGRYGKYAITTRRYI